MSDSILTSTPVGTPSIKHHWTGWLGLLVPLLPWLWCLLAVGHVTYTAAAGHVWIGLLISGIWVLLAAVGLGVSQWGAVKEQAANENETMESSSAIVNDLAFYKTSIINGLQYFVFELTVYLVFFNLPATSNYTSSFHKDDVDLFISTGAGRMIAAVAAHVVGFLLSGAAFLSFFQPWSHMALAQYLAAASGNSKKGITAAYGAPASGNKPISKWGSKGEKSATVV